LLVVLTGRPPFDAAALDCGRVAHSVLRLEPLADSAIESLLAAFFGAESPFEPALQERIVRQAGGNPLYLEEVVRGLISNGVLTRGADGRWRCDAAAGNVDVPSSIEALLLSRMDRLPPAARRTLQSAAILGPLFESALLGAVDEAAADPALLALLCDAELLVPMAAGRRRLRRIRRRAIASPAPWRTTSRTRTCCCGVAPSCISASARCSKACTEPAGAARGPGGARPSLQPRRRP
jgi:hypothetical protein